MAARSTLPRAPGRQVTVAPRAARAASWGALHGGVNPHRAAGFENLRVHRRLEQAVDDHAKGLAWRFHQPDVQPGVVLEHGAYARQNGAGPGAPGMAVGPRFGRGDPLALAVFQGGGAVQRGGDLHAHPGGLADHAAEEADVEFFGLRGAGAHVDRDAGRAQALKALAGNFGIGVRHGGDDFADARGNQGVAAGPVRPWWEQGSSVT